MIVTRRRALSVVLAVLVVLGVAVAQADTPAHATGTVTLTGYGADSCTAPSESQMSAFWRNTPYSYWGIYIGGSDRACSQPNLTKTWVSDMLSMGWDLLPLWVGPQNPCTAHQATYFSTNTSTAYNQGVAEAKSAYNAWTKLSSVSNFPVVYDLESPSSNSATCRAAAKSFINGWDTQLHVAPAQRAGVYSSSCGGDMDDFAGIATPPDFIDAADWDGSPSTGSISCIASNHWTHYQRHKQYQGGHNATYNGVTLNIDSDCSNGSVYGTASRESSSHACAPGSSAAVTRAAVAANGPASWHGAQWTSGGPLDSQLLRDGTPVPIGSLPVRSHGVPATAATVGTPQLLDDGSLLVPVTSHGASGNRERLYTTTDGSHFAQRAAIALHGALGAGVVPAVAARSGSQAYVLDPDGMHASVWSPAVGARPLATSGLPSPPSSLTFSTTQHGTATIDHTACPSKASCAPVTHSYTTGDGGRSWQRS